MGPHTFALDKVGVGEQNACEVMDQWIRLCKLESRVDKLRLIGQELLLQDIQILGWIDLFRGRYEQTIMM